MKIHTWKSFAELGDNIFLDNTSNKRYLEAIDNSLSDDTNPKNGRFIISHGFANAQYDVNFQSNSNLDILDKTTKIELKNETFATKIPIPITRSDHRQNNTQFETQLSTSKLDD